VRGTLLLCPRARVKRSGTWGSGRWRSGGDAAERRIVRTRAALSERVAGMGS
jgi:hypothetical protein